MKMQNSIYNLNKNYFKKNWEKQISVNQYIE